MLPPALLITDLDGTLLDHDNYGWGPALPALEALDHAGIPVVPASSKTSDEIADLLGRMGRAGPWIAENGAVLGQLPDDGPWLGRPGPLAVAPASLSYQRLREVLVDLRHSTRWLFRGFGDLGPRGVAARTGLTEDDARRACRRTATEPLAWDDPDHDVAQLSRRLELRGIRLLTGGRFHTAGPQLDKADGARALLDHWFGDGPRPLLLAAGDSPNDRALLELADWALVIPRLNGGHLDVAGRHGTLCAPEPGPRGWNAAVHEVLRHLESLISGDPHG